MNLPQPSSASRPGLRCEVSASSDASVQVAAIGELDMATAPALEAELASLQQPEIVLDLRQLTFMDSTGLHLLIRTARGLAAEGRGFKVTQGSPAIQRLFELTGFDTRLDFVTLDGP